MNVYGDYMKEPIPRRWHRCKIAMFGVIGGEIFDRCACGGIRVGRVGPWLERNSRRKESGK